MADTEQELELGFVNAAKTSQAARNDAVLDLGTRANYVDVGSLRTRLAAANGAYYTTARLNNMTKNDMVYALRTIDDANTINARGAGA